MRKHKVVNSLLSVLILTLFLVACASYPQVKTTSTIEKNTTALNTSNITETKKDGQLDSFKNPIIVPENKVKVYYIHSTTTYESQYRSIWTAKVEAAHRGWTLVDLQYESASEYLDLFKTALSDPNITAIICGVVAGFEGYGNLVAEARNKGIGVYSNDNMVIKGVICNSTSPNGIASMELAYKIGEKYNWNLKYGILTAKVARIHMERSAPFRTLAPLFTNMKELAYDDGSSNSAASTLTSFDIVKTWLKKYKDLNWIFSTNDNNAINASEAIIAAGRQNEIFVTGVGGGSSCWQYIRKNTPFKYSYAQPYELMTHEVFEVIADTQVRGIYPGKKNATLLSVGETLYFNGVLVGKSNVPNIGESIHSVFNYYNSKDSIAWYNWVDGPGILYVTDGTTKK